MEQENEELTGEFSAAKERISSLEEEVERLSSGLLLLSLLATSNKLESSTNVLLDTFDDSKEIIASNSEAKILKFLQDFLTSSRTTIDKQSNSRKWYSVFWNDDNYRPDKTAKTVNELYKKQDKGTQKKMIAALE